MRKFAGIILCFICSVCMHAQSYEFKFNSVYPYMDKIDFDFYMENESYLVLDLNHKTIVYSLFTDDAEHKVMENCSIVSEEKGDGSYTTYTVQNSKGQRYLVRYVFGGNIANSFYIIFDRKGVYNFLLPTATRVNEIAPATPKTPANAGLIGRIPESSYVLGIVEPRTSFTLKGDFDNDGKTDESIRYDCESNGYSQLTVLKNEKYKDILSFPDGSEIDRIFTDETAGNSDDLIDSEIELARADIDNDGREDFLLALRCKGNLYLDVFRNLGQCSFKWVGELQPTGDIPYVEDHSLYISYGSTLPVDEYIIRDGKLVMK